MFLGVDGGGTKTALCLLDRAGRVAAQVRVGSSYYFSDGIGLVGRVLEEGVSAVCVEAGISPAEIEYAFFGLPTYGEVSGDIAALDATPRTVLGHDRYACNNDMVCGWAGSLAAEDGINIISGTGSMTYGRRAGRGIRVGGWGELFGDEGSAYWIAIRGLNAFSRMCDGRLPAGPLIEILRQHLDLTADLNLVDIVLNRWQGARNEIAALSPLIVEAAEQGDSTAVDILLDAGRELALLVEATRQRLSFADDAVVPVSYSGGTFTASEVLDAFAHELRFLHEGYDLRNPSHPPVIGAALYAAQLAGNPLDHPALDRLREISTPATS